MAISTNGTIITRLAGALYGEYLSNASYTELSSTAPAAVAADFLKNDFAGKSDAQIATAILTNLGLTSITGLDNWVAAQLTASGSTAAAKGAKLVEMLNGYANMTADATYGSYATTFNTKVASALTISQTAGSAAGTWASVSSANPALTLTSAVQTSTGTSGDDTFTAAAGTWGAGDVVNGGAGTDTLNATITGTAPTQSATSLVGVEVLNLTASPNPSTLDLTGVTGLTQVNNVSSANGATLAVSGLGNVVNTSITGGNTSTTVSYATAAVAGTADAATLTLNGTSASSSFTTSGVETLTVNSATAENTLASLTDTGITRLNITGDKALTVTAAVGGSTIATVDASAATGAITLTTGAGAGGTAATGVTVTAPTAATAGLFTVTTGANKDTVTLGGGSATINTGAGNDTITASAGANTITPGTGNDALTLGSGVDTVRFAEAGATNADTVSNFGATDVIAINLGSAAVAGTSAASANATFGTVQTGGTSPVLSNVAGTGTGTAISFQAIAPNATATSGTVLGTANVIALNGAYTDGTAAGAITALGTSATTGIATAADGKFLLVTYAVGNIAQVWAFAGDTTLDTDITAAELSLVATLNGVTQNSLTAANFSTYLTAATTSATTSNNGQTISLTGTLNTVLSTANAAGQYLTSANDTINIGVGTLPLGAATATSGLTIIDPSVTDADVLNATVLGNWAAGSVVSGIETINLNMLVAGTTFSAAAQTPGTSQFGLTGTQNFTVTAMPVGGGVTLGSGYTGTATFGVVSDTGAADSVVVNLAGSTATSATVGANIAYVELNADSMETATVNVSAASSIRMSGADLFAAASDITATNLAGAGNLTIFGTAANLGTLNLNASGVGYTGNLTLRPTTNAAMDFSVAGAAGTVTGIKTIDLQDVATGTFASLITLDSANSTTNAPVTVSYAPVAAGTLGAWSIAQEGSGLSDSVTLSLGANASASGNITATSIETFTVNSSRASTGTLTLGDITLTDGAGSQTITVTSASTVGAGTLTADTVNFAGVTGTVTGVTLANTAGASFTGGSGNTTVAGSANADVINTGIGNDAITGLAGADIINAGNGTNTITGGAGADVMTGGTGADTYVIVVADVGDTITNFNVAADIIDWNTALVGITAANTTPLFYQAAAAGTAIAAATTVFELTGVTTAGSAANLVTALGATATNADIDANDNLLIINYLAGGGAQIWNFIDASGADIAAGELTLVATLVGVAADAITTANFI